MNQIQVTCDKECIYCNDGFCECDQHLLDIAEEFLRLKRGEEVEHLKERESIGAASMEDCSKYEWDFLHESIWINPWKVLSKEDAAMDVGTLEFESCWYKDKECIECTVNEEDSFLLMDVDERFMYEKNMYNPDVYSNEEKISIIYNQLLKDYEDDSLEDFEDIQNAIIDAYKVSVGEDISYEIIGAGETDILKHLNFHVKLPECDLLELYDRILWNTERKRLITNMTICEDDALLSRYKIFLKTCGIEKSQLKAVTGNEYECDHKKLPNIFDGLFSDFIKQFDYDTNDIHCICNMGYLDEYSDPKYEDVDVMGELINAF